MAEFKLDRIRFRWQNVWADDTEYRKDDIVIYQGKAYVCLFGHTASLNFYDDLNATSPKWELMFDGYTWEGDWQSSTFYHKGAIIKWKGYIYRCILPHTSTAVLNVGPTNVLDNWTLVATTYNWTDVWTADRYYDLGDVAKYNGITYICIAKHKASATFGLENDQSKWEIVTRSDNWRTDWDRETRYMVDDVVRYGAIVYRCVEAHTSTSSVEESLENEIEKWENVIWGVEYKFDWQEETYYKLNDVVKWGSVVYICIEAHTSQTVLRDDNEKWDVYIPGLVYEEQWSLATEYQKGDIVRYGGYVYTALQNNINSTPSVGGLLQDTGNWELLKQGYKWLGEWSNSSQYQTGDVVRNSGHLYIAIADSTANYPDLEVNWQKLVEQEKFRAEWNENNEYFIGDVVTYESTAFVCTARHQGDDTDARPDIDVAGASAYWIVLIQGTSTNVLTTRGDIRTHDGSNTLRYAIGASGETLKVDSGAINWLNFEQTSKVYYVSTEGSDNTGFGLTVNAPFRTVRFACNYILDDYENRAPATIFIKTGLYEEQLPIVVPAGVALVGDELRSTVISPAQGFEDYNMFYVRNGSGIRNMTLQGLYGTLGSLNDFGSRRPSAGAYVSLDPGNGPNDEDCWITTKSPYVQNVTTFGTGCIGMKIDGNLHNGGNKSIVANDFTQVLSDGIGYWAANRGRSELVSVFTYFCYIGYLATEGGILRGTNGNNSYGTYGARAEGVNPDEVPITAEVNNRSLQAQVDTVQTNGFNILALGYSHTGTHYTTASLNLVGGGVDFSSEFTEFRKKAISEIRVVTADSSVSGGLNYQYLLNNAQGGDTTRIILAAADTTGTAESYVGMRVVIQSGKGAGQYAYISGYNPLTKIATVSKESDDSTGWDHLYPGWPIEEVLDSTTRYSIEPACNVVMPALEKRSSAHINQVTSIAHGNGKFVSVSSNVAAVSENGYEYVSTSIPSGNWAKVFGNASNRFIATQPGVSTTSVAFTTDGTTWSSGSTGSATNWTDAFYGNGHWLLISGGPSGTGEVIVSINDGLSWSSTGTLGSSGYVGLAFGAGRYVTVKADTNTASYSDDDGATWTTSTLPSIQTWTDVIYGNGRFVAIAEGTEFAYSFNGVTWYTGTIGLDKNWSSIAYTQGVFMAVNNTDSMFALSQDGKVWNYFDESSTIYALDTSGAYVNVVGGIDENGSPICVANTNSGVVTEVVYVQAKPIIRAVVESSRIKRFRIYDPGSGFTITPTMTVYDPLSDVDVSFEIRLGTDTLAQPVFLDRGNGFATATATISGDGYADIFQTSSQLVLKNVSRLPGPGDNVTIFGIGDVTYRLVSIDEVTGSEPNINMTISISPTLGIVESPEHDTEVLIRQFYSQIRLTGHDFLDIGTGNTNSTRYPDLYIFGVDSLNEPAQENEVTETDGGRVFYTSTDQDGNFRVGELFRVEQSTGIVTVNASYFDLQGLTELALGGIQVGGTAVIIREFSKDGTMIANSNNIVPTQAAIIKYLEARISGGGADAITNALIAGQVRVSGNNITTTSEYPINVPVKIYSTKGVDGHYLASMYYTAFGGAGR